MKVKDILEHFLTRAEWVDREHTVDRVIAGDADAEVERCMVTWMPGLGALRYMAERGLRLLICHEPVFWNHHDEVPVGDADVMDKLQFIKDHDLILLRNHDCWDRWPQVGIPWAWAESLGFDGPPVRIGAGGYQHRYDITPVRLEELALRIAGRCRGLGEPALQVTGPADCQVSRIGLGTGCCCKISTYIDMGCDCSIVCDDGSCYWSDIQRAKDIGHPVIRVNHGTSEEPGMASLARYINGNIAGLHAEHFPHGSIFRLVGAVG